MTNTEPAFSGYEQEDKMTTTKSQLQAALDTIKVYSQMNEPTQDDMQQEFDAACDLLQSAIERADGVTDEARANGVRMDWEDDFLVRIKDGAICGYYNSETYAVTEKSSIEHYESLIVRTPHGIKARAALTAPAAKAADVDVLAEFIRTLHGHIGTGELAERLIIQYNITEKTK